MNRYKRNQGWRGESTRHSLARKGIKTKFKKQSVAYKKIYDNMLEKKQSNPLKEEFKNLSPKARKFYVELGGRYKEYWGRKVDYVKRTGYVTTDDIKNIKKLVGSQDYDKLPIIEETNESYDNAIMDCMDILKKNNYTVNEAVVNLKKLIGSNDVDGLFIYLSDSRYDQGIDDCIYVLKTGKPIVWKMVYV